MKIGVFATGGYTETGGLKSFLHRIAPPDTWEWCCPPVLKPGPRVGPTAAPQPEFSGLTGEALVTVVVHRLREFHRRQFDAILLVDDADCRFRCKDCGSPCEDRRFEGRPCRAEDAQYTRAREWLADLTTRAREAAEQPSLTVFTLLASPEVEAWFIADWERGFGAHLAGPWAGALRHAIDREINRQSERGQIESYGIGRVDGSCKHKLSSDIQHLLATLKAPSGADDTRRPRYGKALDGSYLLKRIDPTIVAERCPRLAGSTLRQLRLATLGQAPGSWP